MSTLRRLRTVFNDKTGLDVIKVSGAHTLPNALKKLINETSIDLVLDIGANEGQFSGSLIDLGFKGKVISLEPVSNAYKVLKEKSSGNKNWSIHQLAAGDKNELLDIKVSKFNVFSSFLERSNFTKANWGNSDVVTTEKVETVRIIDFIKKLDLINRKKNIFLKIDVQGYEDKVIEGTLCEEGNIPKDISTIMIETSLKRTYENELLHAEIDQLLSSLGFSLAFIYPVTRASDLSLNQLDCIYIRSNSRLNK